MKQGATIEKVTIVRQGADAEAFTATQADFNRELEIRNKKLEEEKIAARKAKEEAMKEFDLKKTITLQCYRKKGPI